MPRGCACQKTCLPFAGVQGDNHSVLPAAFSLQGKVKPLCIPPPISRHLTDPPHEKPTDPFLSRPPVAATLPGAGGDGPRRPGTGQPVLAAGGGERGWKVGAGYVGHLRLAAGRPAAHGDVRHEAGRPGRVPGRFPAHPHQRARHRRLRVHAPACPGGGSLCGHPLDRPHLCRPRRRPQALPHRPRPPGAGRLRQRLPHGRLDGRQGPPGPVGGRAQLRRHRGRRPAAHRHLQLRLRLPRPLDPPVLGRGRPQPEGLQGPRTWRGPAGPGPGGRPRPAPRRPRQREPVHRHGRHDGGAGRLPAPRPGPADH